MNGLNRISQFEEVKEKKEVMNTMQYFSIKDSYYIFSGIMNEDDFFNIVKDLAIEK